MNHTVDPNFGAPETEKDVVPTSGVIEIEPVPSVETYAAAQSADRSGFVLPMRPEARERFGEFSLIAHICPVRFADSRSRIGEAGRAPSRSAARAQFAPVIYPA
ncbi:MAG: hypothetical protein ACLGSD_17480 [Acidobacteriota bacterium]